MSALRNVVIERDGNGVLVVRWHADVPVDVSVGATLVAVEHTSHARSVAAGSLRLETRMPR